ncbi:MAG: hypothetical protein CFH41_01333 [Alphaproteobacteria bacterium MarineAlpha11_Bin1]|nr:MAG: hypothetical protein CFH41_01333 [Alphaproteobacteria bacterium MarineAlpha11_Bin1]
MDWAGSASGNLFPGFANRAVIFARFCSKIEAEVTRRAAERL